MNPDYKPSRRTLPVAVLILAISVIASSSVTAEHEAIGASLFGEWPDYIELPPPGQVVLHIDDQVLVFDDIVVCGVVEDGLGFMMRAGREDEEGRYQSFRMYRRLAGDRSAMASEEDLVQLAVRGHDNVWSHAVMRLQRRRPGESVTEVNGKADDWPAVNVRHRGTGAWAKGELRRSFDSSDDVLAGDFLAIAHCPRSQ